LVFFREFCKPLLVKSYFLPKDNEARCVIFSDKVRIAYFDEENAEAATFVHVPTNCSFYIHE
jgi:hypothetical protein